MIDEGKTDVDISESLGIQVRFLRRIRDQNNRPRSSQWAHLELTSEQMNDIIDLIREGSTLTQISEEIGVAKWRIKNFREEEVRSGNTLPDFKIGISRGTQRYTDEELIDLAFLNQGFGFMRFIERLSISRDNTLDLFIQFKEFTNGEEDPYAYLQDDSNSILVTENEYMEITGQSIPSGYGRRGGRNRGGGRINRDIRHKGTLIPLPPQMFNWGDIENKDPPRVEKRSTKPFPEAKIEKWISEKISLKGYICSNEDRDDFLRIFRSETQTLTRSMRKAGLLYDRKTGRWTKGNR